MATILRSLSYRYQWLYDSISAVAALSVGGIGRFHRLPLADLPLGREANVLDLCCGCGQATQVLVQHFDRVTGLDASPRSLGRAQAQVPQAHYVQGFAEAMPLEAEQFDLVHSSAALHEMEPEQLRQILREIHRVLKPQGYVTLLDFHPPQTPFLWPGLALFFWLFETETAWQFLEADLGHRLGDLGFGNCRQRLYAGGSLQVLQAQKQGGGGLGGGGLGGDR
ncbi:class I SAM-dependent methyltransferase [Prochlorothrix hollandica]|uniref:SAM-dependent methlyltransferase n=1 Tax=Prochlorothrix hollandica PCC 9006 = CALU 1027 TaxID=317619 RepID=A0A0M2PSS0_PROHO|nr:class I SAM-dependent methyltransferase [Prochlorothrix hollandica]KKI99580.1 SAM-dependent methlyltransferase [Prochlorothrix hollandica PCC 9006 = CALU 1027]